MRLWPYLDGALSEDERERVARHSSRSAAIADSHFYFADVFLDAVAASHRT